jgi:hypothetical protein
MAAYHKVEVSLNTNAVEVGIPSPQTVSVTLPTIGPAGPTGSVGPVGPTGPQGVPGTGLEVLTTQGDILYQGASTGQRLAIGTSGQILKVSGGIPSWANESGAVTSVNGETGTVILDGSEIDTSANDNRSAFTMGAFGDGNGLYYPLPDVALNSKRTYRATTGHYVFFENLRWHITDGSPITANIIESSDNDNAAWPWLSAWSGEVDKAKIADVIGRARDTFLFVGDSVRVGTSSGLPLKTGSGGAVEASSFGTAAGSFCEGNDARLSDDRDPNLHAASHLPEGADEIFDQSLNADDAVAFESVTVENQLNCLGSIDFSQADTISFPVIATSLAISEGGNFNTGTFRAEADSLTANRTYDLPNASGTLALQGAITTSGLTQSTARLIGRTSSGTGAVEEITIGSGLSLSAGELSATGGGSGGTKTYAVFTATDNQPPATAFATLDTRNSSIAVLDFDDTTDESAVFVGIMPEGASLGSGLKIRLHWMSTNQTSNNVVWDVSIERMTTDLDADSFDTIASGTAAANTTQSGILTVTEITLTTIDSVTAGDGYRLKVTRDANNGSDNMSNDAELVAVEVRSAA